MEYGKIGNTDIEVSKLCVGCMSFGKAGTMHDWTLDEVRSEKVIKHALDLGYNFFDTSNGYSAGTSEQYLGKALKKNIARDKVVIASKVYFNIKLTAEDITYLEEPYVPHKIVGAIDKNPKQGVILLDEKK